MANDDPVGTVYEDGSVKGGKRAGDSPDDNGGGGGGGYDPSQPRDPTNGQWVPIGGARDEAGAKAQGDKKAAANYDALLKGSSSDQGKQLSGMSDADLKALTAYIYSSKTSDPNIVRGRMSVAAEMGNRGMDVKDHGALGGGIRAAAGAATEYPPIDWFRDPGLGEVTPVTVTADGRVYGHIASWDTQHVGMPGRNVRPPRSRADYGYFHTGAVVASDHGAPVEISVGHLTLDTGHASLSADAGDAAAHYDNTGAQVAAVCAGEDQHGIWFAGAVDPGVDELRLRKLRASAVSGDWRPINNNLELVAALMVNTPGFPIPRARVASAAELVPVVAAGMIPNRTEQEALVSAPTPQQGGPPQDGTVTIGDTGLVGRIVEQSESGVVVEVTVPPDELRAASEEQAVAASAKLTTRQQLRSLSASVSALTEQLAARDRADEAARLLQSVPTGQ